MMRFLKSILSKNNDAELNNRIDKLQCDLVDANARVDELNDAIKTLAHSYAILSQELMCVGEIIRQAANMASQGDRDLLSLKSDTDDGGYLN